MTARAEPPRAWGRKLELTLLLTPALVARLS